MSDKMLELQITKLQHDLSLLKQNIFNRLEELEKDIGLCQSSTESVDHLGHALNKTLEVLQDLLQRDL